MKMDIYEWSGSGFKSSIPPLWPSKKERKQEKKTNLNHSKSCETWGNQDLILFK